MTHNRSSDIRANFTHTLSMKSLALNAIRFYQRFISPHKGFSCAYASVSGHGSCSALGYRAIRRYGVWQGIALLDQRLKKCGVAYRRHCRPILKGPLTRQAGFLDCACDMPSSCDLPCDGVSGCHMPHFPDSCDEMMRHCGDAVSCPGCDCDWRRRKQTDDEYVDIPVRGHTADRARQIKIPRLPPTLLSSPQNFGE